MNKYRIFRIFLIFLHLFFLFICLFISQRRNFYYFNFHQTLKNREEIPVFFFIKIHLVHIIGAH
jgi:hypothetical protein